MIWPLKSQAVISSVFTIIRASRHAPRIDAYGLKKTEKKEMAISRRKSISVSSPAYHIISFSLHIAAKYDCHSSFVLFLFTHQQNTVH